MFIRTERLFLRPAWPDDLDDLVQTLAEDGIQPTVGVAPLPRTMGDIRAYLERERDPRHPHLIMYLRAPGGAQMVGGIGLEPYDEDENTAEVDFWIAASHKGRGFGREGLLAIMDQARSFGYRRIVASHFTDNIATHRVLESAGFRDTGQVRSRFNPSGGMEYAARFYVAELVPRSIVRTPPVSRMRGNPAGTALSA